MRSSCHGQMPENRETSHLTRVSTLPFCDRTVLVLTEPRLSVDSKDGPEGPFHLEVLRTGGVSWSHFPSIDKPVVLSVTHSTTHRGLVALLSLFNKDSNPFH